MRPLPHRSILVAGGVVTLAALLAPNGHAFTVTADTQAQLCRVDPTSPSTLRDFWDTLEADLRAARIAEIEHASPGFSDALKAYESGTPASPTAVSELQQRITDAGGTEGLGMLTSQTATDAGITAATGPEFQTEYTEHQARAAADDIGDDPAAAINDTLAAHAATGMRIDALRAELFAARTAEYNTAQHEVRDNLRRCADELADARPMPLQQKIFIAVAVFAGVAVALRAWFNSREPSRHQAK